MPVGTLLATRLARHASDHKEMANDFGKAAAASLGFLLVPVSRHSSLMAAAGMESEVAAVRLHVVSGCVAMGGSAAHGLYYVWRWIHKGRTVWEVLPPAECWAAGYGVDCYDRFVNLTGLLCATAMSALGAASLNAVRRRRYGLFYAVHAATSVALLLGLVMHYRKMIWYLAPGLLCYLGTAAPALAERLDRRHFKRGVRCEGVVLVPDSGGCVDIAVGCPPPGLTARDAAGKYAHLTVPEVSPMGHPFTVVPSADGRAVRFLFRPAGPFTRALSGRLGRLVRGEGGARGRRCPMMLVDGLRRTGRDMVGDALGHGRVLVVCGGVGVTPYLSLIRALREVERGDASEDQGGRAAAGGGDPDDDGHVEDGEGSDGGAVGVCPGTTTRVDVHWMCREAGLADHVVRNYLDDDGGGDYAPRARRPGPPRVTIDITVHLTSPPGTGPADDPFDCDEEDAAPRSWPPPDRPAPPSPGRASPRSPYELGRPTLSSNAVPALTSAAIGLGGLGVVSFCASRVQSKHVAETRLVAVVGLAALSAFVSFASLSAAKIAGLLLRPSGRYSAVGPGGDDGNVELARAGAGTHAGMGERDDDVVPSRGGGAPARRAATANRSRGRPDVGAIVRDAIAADADGGGRGDSTVGIFVCGPRALGDAVAGAVRDADGRAPCPSLPGRVAVYRESFEM